LSARPWRPRQRLQAISLIPEPFKTKECLI
jgi:hypothetical protein